MKVKTLKQHGNQFGDKYQKEKGDVYEHPSPEADIAFLNVEGHAVDVVKQAPKKATKPK